MDSNIVLALALVALSLYTFNYNNYYHRYRGNEDIVFHGDTAIKIEMYKYHIRNLIDIGNSKPVYEESRALAREYIRDYLINENIHPDNILWNKFEWSEKRADGRNITTTTWTGINIIVWINSTVDKPILDNTFNSINNNPRVLDTPPNDIIVVGCHYDTKKWGKDSTSGAHELAGVGVMLEAIVEFKKVVDIKLLVPNINYNYMFVFFDHETPGSLGSQSLLEFYGPNTFKYFVNIHSAGLDRVSIQTFPYEHKDSTHYTSRQLVDMFIKSAHYNDDIELRVGSSGIGIDGFIKSTIYQASRYHLKQIPYKTDTSAFIWAGVDGILLTDEDIMYGEASTKIKNHYERLNDMWDQVDKLNGDRLYDTYHLLIHFLLESNLQPNVIDVSNLNYFSKNMNGIIYLLFPTLQHYIQIGHISLNSFTILALNFIMLYSIYSTTLKDYKSIVLTSQKIQFIKMQMNRNQSLKPSDIEREYIKYIEFGGGDNSKSFLLSKGYRLLLIHLVLFGVISFVDLVFAFLILALSFASFTLLQHYSYKMNLFISLITNIILFDIIVTDIKLVNQFNQLGQIPYIFLTSFYILHSLSLICYAIDFNRKNKVVVDYERTKKEV